MSATFQVSVVTPEREVLATQARFVAFPAFDGEMGVLARRAPLLSRLGSGLLRIEGADGGKRELFVAGGFAQMVADKLTLLTEEALETEQVTSELVARSLERSRDLPNGSDAEHEKRQRAVDRARALGRASH